ncbi:MAG: hypothetical protein Q8J78_10235 [Moraxellaceae bacterium]|nr:hypothetical protein [Moraxellaceae bacterium]
MSKLSTLTPIAAVLAVSLAGVSHAASNPFGSATVNGAMTLAAHDAGHEGKCGEGKCGGAKTKAKEGKCGEGKCGGAKTDAKAKEGKCGEGKCGGAKTDAKAKAKEGKCGEGKCGSKTK